MVESRSLAPRGGQGYAAGPSGPEAMRIRNPVMQREELFSRQGFYRFIVDCNVLLHREAGRAAHRIVAERMTQWPADAPIRVLDLACGGLPISIASLMEEFPEREFHYTGVDINPDQVELAGSLFEYPPNVRRVRVIEGNAWDLAELQVEGPFELIFSGMNIHHGSPREIRYLAAQLRERLSGAGLFVNHDVYRPRSAPYWPRPGLGPDGVELDLVTPRRLDELGVPQPEVGIDSEPREPAWRVDYVSRLHETVLARGGSRQGADSAAAHMRERDYPISTAEFRTLFEAVGFQVRIIDYDDVDEPLAPYISMTVASLPDASSR